MLGYIAGVALQSVSAGSNYVWTSGAGQNFTICHTCGNTTVVARQPPEHLRNVHCVSVSIDLLHPTEHKLTLTESELEADVTKPVSTVSRSDASKLTTPSMLLPLIVAAYIYVLPEVCLPLSSAQFAC